MPSALHNRLQAGTGAAVDVLHVWPENLVLLRVDARCALPHSHASRPRHLLLSAAVSLLHLAPPHRSAVVKVRSALTLLTVFDRKPCHCHTLQVRGKRCCTS